MRRMRVAKNIYQWTVEQSQNEMAAWNMANHDKADAIAFARGCAIELGFIEKDNA